MVDSALTAESVCATPGLSLDVGLLAVGVFRLLLAFLDDVEVEDGFLSPAGVGVSAEATATSVVCFCDPVLAGPRGRRWDGFLPATDA